MVNSIETDMLTKRYGPEMVVDGVDLEVAPGTIYGLLGPNGAGKTTLIRMLSSLLRPTSGTGRVAGHAIEQRDAVASSVGYVPESPPLYAGLTGREQLRLMAALRTRSQPEAMTRVDSLLEQFDLETDANRRICSYSKGMKQKIALIQSILHEPDVVFLDEPTSGLDPRAVRTVRDVVLELADDGTTVFLSTHILSVVEELADAVGILYGGALVAQGTPNELRRRAENGESTLENAFIEITDAEERNDRAQFAHRTS